MKNNSFQTWLRALPKQRKQVITGVIIALAVIIIPLSTHSWSLLSYAEQTDVVAVPFSTVSIQDGNQNIGQTSIKTTGVSGNKIISYHATLFLGLTVNRQQTKEEITKQPVNQEILTGTKHITTETASVPYDSITTRDASQLNTYYLVKTNGVNGQKTLTYEISQNEGQPENKKLIKEEVTTPPIRQVVVVGTIPIPSGATAWCYDGWFSYSQSRSGTCSHHGGVAQWL